MEYSENISATYNPRQRSLFFVKLSAASLPCVGGALGSVANGAYEYRGIFLCLAQELQLRNLYYSHSQSFNTLDVNTQLADFNRQTCSIQRESRK